MTRLDRATRAAFVALAVGLGWGIRGDFGHQLGAMVPGALLAMTFAYVSGQDRMFRMLPLMAFVGAITMSLGGTMSYGTLHGYAKSASFVNNVYGFVTLFLVGGVWGGPCGAGLGLLLEERPVTFLEWVRAVLTVLLWAVLTHAVVVNMLGFHINPPRSDIAIGFFGGMAGLFFWLYRNNRRFGLKGALYGFIGFGMSMAFSRFLANASHILPIEYDTWKIMEMGCGMIGGFLVAYALLGKEARPEPLRPWVSAVGYVGLFFVMIGIPVLHWVQRMPRSDTEEKVLAHGDKLGVADPQAFVDSLQHFMFWLQIAAVIGVIVWLVLHIRNARRGFWFPIMFFALILLITSNVRSVFPFVPRDSATWKVQASFWVLFVLMALFLVLWRRRPAIEPDVEADRLHFAKAVGVALAVFLVMLIANAPVNGLAERYGRKTPDGRPLKPNDSANTRFPLKAYND